MVPKNEGKRPGGKYSQAILKIHVLVDDVFGEIKNTP